MFFMSSYSRIELIMKFQMEKIEQSLESKIGKKDKFLRSHII